MVLIMGALPAASANWNVTVRAWRTILAPIFISYAQALDGTWSEYKKSTGRFAARRSSIRDAADFMGWYMTETKRRTRVALSDVRNQYLAYHEGQSGYMRGTYRKKPWLIEIANNVANRSETYRRQLKSCGKI